MERFKHAMGFPMLAVAVWLLTLTVPHFGNAGVLWVGLFLVAVAIAAWVWGQFVQRGSPRGGLAMSIAALILAGGYFYALEVELNWRTPPVAEKSVGALRQGKDGIPWQPWSADAVEQARAEGRPVLVDFTADWCLTCQANKKTSLEIASVREKLKTLNAAAFLGDYTREDPAIAAELRRFNRAGVPLVLVYPKDAARPPIVLPPLLTPSIVREALDNAAQ
jgi:thiol:disulfide interchange protein DsbD